MKDAKQTRIEERSSLSTALRGLLEEHIRICGDTRGGAILRQQLENLLNRYEKEDQS